METITITLYNNIAYYLCIKLRRSICLMLTIELSLIVIVGIILSTRLFITKHNVACTNHWAYNYPRVLRNIQSPIWWVFFSCLVGILIAHFGFLYPSSYARYRNYQLQLESPVSMAKTTQQQVKINYRRIMRAQLPWALSLHQELKYSKSCMPIRLLRSWSGLNINYHTSTREIDKKVTNIMAISHITTIGGSLMFLLGLLLTLLWSIRQGLGPSDHGQAAWGARSEVIYNKNGYWWLPLRVMSRGQRKLTSLNSAPLTIARPPVKTNTVHTIVIGSSGSGKGAYLGGHIFATSTVPIVYFDYKGEMPAAILRPQMLRWGFPGEQPKGLPSLRFNFIEWALTRNDPDLAAKTLASALLPTNTNKETENQWIKDTAIPIIAQGILSGRWYNLAELADEIEHSPLMELLNKI